MPKGDYKHNVFVNVPFDPQYVEMFDAIIFTIQDCGFIPRCTKEVKDSSQRRVEVIAKLISECKYGIHDISRTELDEKHMLPRFNMPFELGFFMGAQYFGGSRQKRKVALILEKTKYSYQKYCSDIAGQDLEAHDNDNVKVVKHIRNWLQSNTEENIIIPSGKAIYKRFQSFKGDIPEMCKVINLDENDLSFDDYSILLTGWLEQNQLQQ